MLGPGREGGAAEALEGALAAHLAELISPARRQAGNWGGVRATADALLAMSTCLPVDALPSLRSAATGWLLSRRAVRPGHPGCLWEGEAWDSAVTVLTLGGLGRHGGAAAGVDEAVTAGVAGLLALFQEAHANWNDEPWETCWALLALADAEGAGLPAGQAAAALRWLASLVDRRGSGLLVNWHYSALFLLVVEAFDRPQRWPDGGGEVLPLLREAGQRVQQRLLDDLAGARPGTLWTEESWSNGLVLWALARRGALHGDTPGLAAVGTWFRRGTTASLEVEELAFACLGLFAAVEALRRAQASRLLAEAALPGAALPELVREAALRGWHGAFAATLQQELWRRLSGDARDHVPAPPLLTRELPDHYSLHLPRRATRVVLVLGATGLITALSSLDALGLSAGVARIATVATLAIGALATVLSLVESPSALLGRSARADPPESS